MPTNFPISSRDVLRSKAVKPGLYILNIDRVDQGPGKKDPTANTTTINMSIESGPGGDTAFAGVPIDHYLSEKAPGMAINFIEAVTGQKVPDTGINPDLDSCVGRKVKAYIKNEMYQGRPTNKVEGFMPV
jgi:hypothetical protein